MCGISCIIYWLKKFNILRRSNAEAVHVRKVNYCNLTKEAFEWLNGELLGDASLNSRSPFSARLSYTSKYLEYCEYVSNTLALYGIEQTGNINKRTINDKRCKGEFYSYTYTSLRYEELYPLYKRWYPEGKKIVPKNIKLIPLTIRQWYIGDGCLIHTKKGNPYITLATNAFIISDVEWLKEQLIKIGFKVIRQPSNILRISSYSIMNFLNYIGKCPVRCYQYKFDY